MAGAKLQDRILDRLADEDDTIQFITPDAGRLQMAGHDGRDLPHVAGGLGCTPWRVQENDFFRRLAFMFGQPFLVSNLHDRMTQAVVRTQFGAIPFKIYRHAAQNALRGFAAPFGEEGKLDPKTTQRSDPGHARQHVPRLEAFHDLNITLITGAENPLWHRESIDRMAEWLARRGGPQQTRARRLRPPGSMVGQAQLGGRVSAGS